jgi:hypothetical protein
MMGRETNMMNGAGWREKLEISFANGPFVIAFIVGAPPRALCAIDQKSKRHPEKRK